MICDKFKSLSDFDQSMYMAKLLHAAINNDENFEVGSEIIRLGQVKGLFLNVKFGNDEINGNDDLTNVFKPLQE